MNIELIDYYFKDEDIFLKKIKIVDLKTIVSQMQGYSEKNLESFLKKLQKELEERMNKLPRTKVTG